MVERKAMVMMYLSQGFGIFALGDWVTARERDEDVDVARCAGGSGGSRATDERKGQVVSEPLFCHPHGNQGEISFQLCPSNLLQLALTHRDISGDSPHDPVACRRCASLNFGILDADLIEYVGVRNVLVLNMVARE